MKDSFRIIANRISVMAGSAYMFAGAVFVILVWASTGPLVNFSDTWQLVINTTTTIVTFLMVFLIQNTQNRDAKAMHLKLDELIHSNKNARNSFVSLEDISDEELLEISKEFQKIHSSSPSTPAMKKLHKKIEEEHAKRRWFREKTGQFVASALSPLNHTFHK